MNSDDQRAQTEVLDLYGGHLTFTTSSHVADRDAAIAAETKKIAPGARTESLTRVVRDATARS